jgi:hypothetical protein
MTQRDTILQELNELESSLVSISSSNVYSVPSQYFEGLATTIMGRIKALEFLETIGRETPYKVPAGYFDGLEKRIMEAVLQSGYEQTPEEELESLSPLLSGLKKTSPYSVPNGYFENLGVPSTDTTREKAKVVSLTNRKWFRYAAAAMVTGVVAISSFLIFGNNDPAKPEDIVKQTVKSVGEEGINNFIELTGDEIITEETPAIAQAEIKAMVRNISDEEIQDFVDDAQATESDPGEDILLN